MDVMSLKLSFMSLASRVSDFYKAHVFWRKIERALALHRRGEARSDGLQLTSAKTTLHIEWLARDVHPWDRGRSRDQTERLFSEQCLADANAAISRLFAEVPVLDAIEVRVLRDPAQAPLLAGVVKRSDLYRPASASIAMRLRSLGIKFRMHNLLLEPTDVSE
jgi:hypothetical protein